VILGTSSWARNIGTNAAIAIGGYIGIVAVWGAPVTGASMNPARSVQTTPPTYKSSLVVRTLRTSAWAATGLLQYN
jgi:hypothetical protein